MNRVKRDALYNLGYSSDVIEEISKLQDGEYAKWGYSSDLPCMFKDDKKEEKKPSKAILNFNGKQYLKCDQCGNLTSAIPCDNCGGAPVKDLDSLWNTGVTPLNSEERVSGNDPYFADGGVSMMGGGMNKVW